MSALRDAYELIKDERRWCRFEMATVSPDGRYRYCARGAMQRCLVSDVYLERLNAVAIEMFPESREFLGNQIVYVNDNLGHKAVLTVFEKVLAEEGMLA